MKLYNTLSRTLDTLEPLNPPAITVYTCGPTVYDYPHIGNWFTFIRYDVLIRTLKVSGLEPVWVMNITDVGHLVSDADEGEDKLEKGARREGKSAWDIAKLYGDYFIDGLKRLNISAPNYIPKATEHIEEQIDMIKRLEAKGFTYAIDDGVYYDTAKFPSYANFARLNLDEQQPGARVEINPQKRNDTDFALWKFSPKDHQRDMEWDSPWSKGFPGWHIECSAMALKYLGETLDIHSGGIDHVPVHHTNEIAQSEAANDKPLAKVWMHTNHILIDDDKISKSLGNSLTLEDIEAKGFSLEAFRLLVLESHYRSQSKFSWETLGAAQNRLHSYRAFADLMWQMAEISEGSEVLKDAKANIITALVNDLDTPAALARLSETESLWLKVLSTESQLSLKNFLVFLDDVFGLKLSQTHDLNEVEYSLLEEREAARKNSDWVKSDELRDKLKDQKIGLRDTQTKAIWFRL